MKNKRGAQARRIRNAAPRSTADRTNDRELLMNLIESDAILIDYEERANGARIEHALTRLLVIRSDA